MQETLDAEIEYIGEISNISNNHIFSKFDFNTIVYIIKNKESVQVVEDGGIPILFRSTEDGEYALEFNEEVYGLDRNEWEIIQIKLIKDLK